MIVPDQAVVLLRALIYAGAIAVSGAVLFRASFPQAAEAVFSLLRRQILMGFLLLLVVEPLRYGAFQLAIAGGDPSLAFGPDMRWLGFETPIGQAAVVRLAAAGLVAAMGLRWLPVGLTAALILIASFLFEGHTVASEARALVASLLFIHLAAVHWWLGALLPLLLLTYCAAPATVSQTMEAFGSRAALVVGVLLAAGATLAVLLTGGVVRLDSAYQQRLLVKLALVPVLLSIAALNKLRLTPLLKKDYALGVSSLRTSIRVEIGVALAILAVSAWLVGTAADA